MIVLLAIRLFRCARLALVGRPVRADGIELVDDTL
jgi:hypothetical protein